LIARVVIPETTSLKYLGVTRNSPSMEKFAP
jgi:hypothetical protein